MAAKIINVLVTCTKRKTHRVSKLLHLGKTPGRSCKELAANWVAKLKSSAEIAVVAKDLYAGDQWQIAKSLPAIGGERGLTVQLWICSAGYGLIPADATVRPYSATFSAAHPDTVRRMPSPKGIGILDAWWRELASWRGPSPSRPRSIAKLAAAYPESPLLIVASTAYLGAMQADIELALRSVCDPDLITIVSGGTDTLGTLSENLLPCDARLQGVLGGARMSLNVRVARRILSASDRWPLLKSDLTITFRRWLAKQPALIPSARRSISDQQVLRFIVRQLARDSTKRPTPLLQLLRENGFACEQKRFNAIYRHALEN